MSGKAHLKRQISHVPNPYFYTAVKWDVGYNSTEFNAVFVVNAPSL